MILACSQGLRGILIVWALTLPSTLTHLPHHALCLPLNPSLCSVSLLPCSLGFLPQSTTTFPLTPLLSYLLLYLQATMKQSDVVEWWRWVTWHFGFFLVVWWQPVLGPVLSDSCLSCLGAACLFLRPGWPSSACQPPWWSLADIRYNLLGAVMPAHISHLTSLQCCL